MNANIVSFKNQDSSKGPAPSQNNKKQMKNKIQLVR